MNNIMSHTKKKECCKGCKNGEVGGNAVCKAKLMVNAINQNEQEKTNKHNV